MANSEERCEITHGQQVALMSGFLLYCNGGANVAMLNISNHPSSTWTSAQTTAAEKLSGFPVVDIPFPKVDPEWTTQDIYNLAQHYLSEYVDLFSHDSCVHIMGEYTFTYTMVNVLQRCGVDCYAATTVRNTQMLEDGTKLSKFEFVQFRRYPEMAIK